MPNLFSLEMHLLVMLQRNYWKVLHKVTNFCTVVPYESKMTMFLLSIQHFIIFVTMLCSGLTKKEKAKDYLDDLALKSYVHFRCGRERFWGMYCYYQ